MTGSVKLYSSLASNVPTVPQTIPTFPRMSNMSEDYWWKIVFPPVLWSGCCRVSKATTIWKLHNWFRNYGRVKERVSVTNAMQCNGATLNWLLGGLLLDSTQLFDIIMYVEA